MKLQNPISLFAFWSTFLHHMILLYLAMSLTLQPINTIANAIGTNETERLSLLKFKESISSDPHGVLSSWNDSIHFCNWFGIRCSSRHQKITSLSLQGYDLQGSISPFIGNLTFLRFVNLENNRFSGEIPHQVGHLFRLQHLNLSYNMLGGKIPLNLSYCSKLTILRLRKNRFSGMIPSEFGSLVNLKDLSLAQNNLTGSIPTSLGNISSLKGFSVTYNNLMGTVPDEFGRLKSLTFFAVGSNKLSGIIPLSLYDISSLRTFSITDNQFIGTIPPYIGLTLPNLRFFAISGNAFSGTIPESISNASQLQILDISKSTLVGQVPTSLGNLPYLSLLTMSYNSLGDYSDNSLDFIASLTNCSQLEILSLSFNKFGGVLPTSVANLSTGITRLYLGANQISGTIPTTTENLVNLIVLSMLHNLFTGFIPDSLGKLTKLEVWDLGVNLLSGNIPSSIGNFTRISEFYVSDNKLEGSIPTTIVNFQNVIIFYLSNNRLSRTIPKEIFGLSSAVLLNLSTNSLTGNLPIEMGKLNNVNSLYLSENNLTGEIPETIGDCLTLEFLDLQGNHFQGNVPSTLASLRSLQHLDLSRNNLTGRIPKDLQKLNLLTYLNLSFNDLEGEVPNKGVFQSTSAVSIFGNNKLCGGIPRLQLPTCVVKESNQGKTYALKITIIIVCVAIVVLLVSGFFIFIWRKRRLVRKSSSALSTISFLSKVSYKRLYQATNGFSPAMLLGTGSFGSVYKGILDEIQNPVAVKVLNLKQRGAEKSFIAECNALRNIRHRNLVKILTCFSSIDYNGNEFKALVFEFMLNGSLEKWLHPATNSENRPMLGLNLIQRLNIATDVASAIHYLHDHCDQMIIHCDLKPSNVLLDNEMIAHVSDFGLARLILNTSGGFSKSEASTTGMKGTIGYAAPEYAMGNKPSREGDVYSYGILVLEMFTGKRPTDEMFKDDFNLRNMVKMSLPERLEQMVDSALIGEHERNYNNNTDIEERNTAWSKCLVSVLKIGLGCSEESSNERMKMKDVTKELQHIRNAYLEVGSHGQRPRTN